MFTSISYLFILLAGTAVSVSIPANDVRSPTARCTPRTVTQHSRNCTIECGTDHPGGNYKSIHVQRFQDCINICSADKKCATAQYLTTSSYCYLKKLVSPAETISDVNSVTCSNAKQQACTPGRVLRNGRTGYVECGIDHPGGDYATQYTDTLRRCDDLCAQDLNCKTAQYALDTSVCYLKNVTAPASPNSNVNGIVFDPATQSTTTTTSSTTTPSAVPS